MPGSRPTAPRPTAPRRTDPRPITAPRRAALVALLLALVIPSSSALAAPAPTGPTPPTPPAPTALTLPAVQRGTPIVVTYTDDASFRRGGRAHVGAGGPARQVDSLAPLRMKTFRARAGQDKKALHALAADPGVRSIEYDVTVKSTVTPNDRYWASTMKWAHDKVGLRSAWDTTRGSRSVVIAILDSGLQMTHPEFADRVIKGYDFVEGDRTVDDGRGHGTMSAGVAAARGNNSVGIAGACWSCRILPVKVLDTRGTGYGSWVNRGIVWATDQGADVINMSFGGFKPTASMRAAIDYARSKGVVIVASAGNDGNTSRFYPAAFPGVISVAASDPNDRPYSWSNRGDWVDVTAPGCMWTTKTKSSYGNFCGTSAAAPLVAGIIGLMRSVDPKASPARIESALFRSTRSMGFVKYGLVDAAGAIRNLGKMTAHVEKRGRVVIEAERTVSRQSRGGVSWVDGTSKAGYVGAGYVMANPDTGRKSGADYVTKAAELRYAVKFTTTGTYEVWLRTWAPNADGDTVHVGVNDKMVNSAKRIHARTHKAWAWTRATKGGEIAKIRVRTPGVHIINIWMHEDGMRIDRILLRKDGPKPVGVGPGESARMQVPAK